MGLKDMDSGYKYRAIGGLMPLLGVITGIIGFYSNATYLYGIAFLLVFVGLMLVAFGLTKIVVKKDPEYQDFLRKSNRLLIIILPLEFVLVIGAIIIGLVTKSLLLPSILMFLALAIVVIYTMTIYITVFKIVQYAQKHFSQKGRRTLIIIAIVCVVLGLLLWYFVNFVMLKGQLLH